MELAKANSALKDFEKKFDTASKPNKAVIHQAVLAQLQWRTCTDFGLSNARGSQHRSFADIFNYICIPDVTRGWSWSI